MLNQVVRDADLRSADTLQARVTELEAHVDRDAMNIATLQLALQSARRIGAAIGIVMATQLLTEDDAFALLRQVSQHSNRKLRDIAEDVLATGLCPTL